MLDLVYSDARPSVAVRWRRLEHGILAVLLYIQKAITMHASGALQPGVGVIFWRYSKQLRNKANKGANTTTSSITPNE